MKTEAKTFAVIRELVENSMREAENFPIGGIGEGGPTQADLDEAVENGHPVEDEATLHGAQQIWLNLKKVIDELNAQWKTPNDPKTL